MRERELQRFLSAGRLVDLNLGVRKQLALHLQVHLVVVHDQDPCLRRAKAALVCHSAHRALIAYIQVSDLRVIGNAL